MKNKKKIIITIGFLISAFVVSLFAFVPMNRIHDAYSKTWMSHVDDDTKIIDLSLPGTHNAGALHSIADVSGRCQDIDIPTQLNIGVRFLDLRIQLINNEFIVAHSFVKQNLTFKQVLNNISSFLKANQSEFLILSIKEEEDSVNSTISYQEALKRDLLKYEDVISFQTSLPETVKNARGKAFIISRTSTDFGVPVYSGWANDTTFTVNGFYIQDNYSVPNVEEKKNDILKTINYASENNDEFVINFTSCYLDPFFPPNNAGTPALEINPWLLKTIKNNEDKLGFILMDFITEELSKTIYMRNI